MSIGKEVIGRQVYNLVKEHGAPWSVGTSAIIAGLAVRLISIAIEDSSDIDFSKELKEFFVLCDQDDKQFEAYLHNNPTKLNESTLEILELIFIIFAKIEDNNNYQLKHNLEVDFTIGIDYLLTTAKQLLKIVKANNLVGISEDSYQEWWGKVKEAESHFHREGKII